jgi:hypothetical protein
MSDDKKPREFWLFKDECFENYHVYSGKSNMQWNHSFHVIEYSAYAALQKENEELKQYILRHEATSCDKFMQEQVASLRDQLKLAVEALEFAVSLDREKIMTQPTIMAPDISLDQKAFIC